MRDLLAVAGCPQLGAPGTVVTDGSDVVTVIHGFLGRAEAPN